MVRPIAATSASVGPVPHGNRAPAAGPSSARTAADHIFVTTVLSASTPAWLMRRCSHSLASASAREHRRFVRPPLPPPPPPKLSHLSSPEACCTVPGCCTEGEAMRPSSAYHPAVQCGDQLRDVHSQTVRDPPHRPAGDAALCVRATASQTTKGTATTSAVEPLV